MPQPLTQNIKKYVWKQQHKGEHISSYESGYKGEQVLYPIQERKTPYLTLSQFMTYATLENNKSGTMKWEFK
jgi:hypothetical protein